MKQGTLRRRSKLEIAESKRREAAEKAEIEQKVAQFDALQQQIQQLQSQANAAGQIHGVLQHLKGAGLIKEMSPGNYEGVESYEEHQQLASQRQAESQATLQEVQQEQVMQEEGGYLPSADRMRPSMQLELQEDQPLRVQEFMAESDVEDRDKDDLYAADNF